MASYVGIDVMSAMSSPPVVRHAIEPRTQAHHLRFGLHSGVRRRSTSFAALSTCAVATAASSPLLDRNNFDASLTSRKHIFATQPEGHEFYTGFAGRTHTEHAQRNMPP